MTFFDVGFHGDRYLLALVDHILSRHAARYVETGAADGSTLAYVGRVYPEIDCRACEPRADAAERARSAVSALPRVQLFGEDSQRFMHRLDQDPQFAKRDTLFWLDAHGQGFAWPLRDEVAWTTAGFERSFILIDDCRVPGRPEFGYDSYDGQECSIEYIQPSLANRSRLRLYAPTYRDRTSPHHPLRGWLLIAIDGPRLWPPHLMASMAEVVPSFPTDR